VGIGQSNDLRVKFRCNPKIQNPDQTTTLPFFIIISITHWSRKYIISNCLQYYIDMVYRDYNYKKITTDDTNFGIKNKSY